MNKLQPQKLSSKFKNNNLSRNLVCNPKAIHKTKKAKHSKGIINSLEKETQSIALHINSIFRDNYYLTSPSDFTYTLPINCENITSLKLTSVSLPNTWYLFSSEKGNNRFTIEIFQRTEEGVRVEDGYTHIFQIVIPDGNYTSVQLVQFLNSNYFKDLNEGKVVLDATEKRLRNIRFEIDPQSLKSSFHIVDTSSRNEGINLIFTDENQNSLIHSAGWIVGFRKGKYLNIISCIYDTYGNNKNCSSIS